MFFPNKFIEPISIDMLHYIKMNAMIKKIIGVIGAGLCDSHIYENAKLVGSLIAMKGGIVVTGGLGGVMEAASMGAKLKGGITVGIIPQTTKGEANRYVDIPIVTGMGEARNIIIVRTADVLIAIGGEYGTLSEIAFALKMGKPVIGLNTWDIKGIIEATSPEDAVEKAFSFLEK